MTRRDVVQRGRSLGGLRRLTFGLTSGLTFVLLSGCGALGGEPGGSSNLPNRGLTPYAIHREDGAAAPVLEPPEGARLGAPAALVTNEGVELLFELVRGSTKSVGLARSSDGFQFGPITEPAELEGFGDPAVRGSVMGLGLDEDTIQLRVGGLLVATIRAEEPFELGGISAPSIVLAGEEVWVYYAAADVSGRPVAARARFDGSHRLIDQIVVLEPRSQCQKPSGSRVPCWDEDGVFGPEVRRATSGAGRTLFRMMFSGGNGSSRAIGFAASFDGTHFEELPDNPVLDEVELTEANPSNVRLGDEYLLYFEHDGKIYVATNQHGQATEAIE